MNEKIDLPITELLIGLAEECCELSKAALKLRRCYDGTNPTPVSSNYAYEKLLEEIADVELYLEQIPYNVSEVKEIKADKMARWVTRMKLRNARNSEETS